MDEEIEGGQAGTEGATLGSSEVAPSASETVSAGQSSDGASMQPGGNGQVSSNWKPLLEAVPEQFHSVAIPTLEKWDKHYNEMAQAYAPFKKQFVDQGVTLDTLGNAYKLFDLVSRDPQEVFRRLAGELERQGVKVNELIPGFVAQAVPEQETENEAGGQEVDPVIKEMQDRLASQQQFIDQFQAAQQQSAYEQQVQAASKELDAEIKAIQATDPNVNLSDLFTRYSAQLALAEKAMQAGQRVPTPTMQQAYKEQQAFIQSIRGNTGNTAPNNVNVDPPKIMPSGGSGIPGNTTQAKPETAEDRARKIEALIMASNQ
jgi:hypothetical protein